MVKLNYSKKKNNLLRQKTKKGGASGEGNTSNIIPEGTTTITRESWSDWLPKGQWGASPLKDDITNITIPSSVTVLDNYAFANFPDLEHLIIPSSVTVIGAHAFSNCRNLVEIRIPNSVIEIGKECFVDCTGLRTVTFEPTHEKESSVETIGTGAFRRCTSLLNIVIPNSVTEIKDDTFTACHMLQPINIPTSVTSIGKMAFINCSAITQLIIPDSVTSIGKEAFRGCTSLLGLTIPRSMTKINPKTFNGCTSLELVTIPDSVTEIGTGAFTQCPRLNIDFGNIDRLEDPVLIRNYPDVLRSYPRTATTIKQLSTKDSCVVRYEWGAKKRGKEVKPTPIEVVDFSGIVSPILLQTLSGNIYEVHGCWNATPENPIRDFKKLAAEQHEDLRPANSWRFQIPNTDFLVDILDLGGGRESVTMMLVRDEITLDEPWFCVWKDGAENQPGRKRKLKKTKKKTKKKNKTKRKQTNKTKKTNKKNKIKNNVLAHNLYN